MKIVLISDFHFGIYNDDENFIQYQLKCLNNFIKYVEKNKINDIFILGDIFDKKRFINFKTLYHFKRNFFDKIKDKNVYIILGDHDIYYKNNDKINSLELVLSEYNFKIIEQNKIIKIDNKKIYLVNWIIDQNEFLNELMKVESDYCFGHFKISKYYKNGLDVSVFNKFKFVFSGHYHTNKKEKNFYYVGTPYQLDIQDLNIQKGFYVFDLKTEKMKFVKNKEKLFYEIKIEDDNFDEQLKELKSLKDKFIKVLLYVKDKKNIDYFYDFINFINFKKILIEKHNDDFEADLNIKENNLFKLIEEYINTEINYKDKEKIKNIFFKIIGRIS